MPRLTGDYTHDIRKLKWQITYLKELAARARDQLLKLKPNPDQAPTDLQSLLGELDIAIGPNLHEETPEVLTDPHPDN
ncbi:hypothetical protein V5E97_10580 [Singulisphaera sp. Ch08]|uniref:Uncharacterized protein n=1 Tax=Singulisphaera sp. Ch08 TaxID=3120278 RepID=A0AAU7CN61_9BACT